jgi:hypothetical protein
MRELTAIIGMHRSGTSMVANLVHDMGIRVVGDERFLAKGNAHNQGGYWETPELVTLNNRLLAFLGGSWREVPPLPSGWADSPWLLPYRSRAAALIRAIPGDRRAWKDPRLTLTLPFWKRVVPATRYVLCFRNPLDVHRSLERRDGITLPEAVRLWGIYSAVAIRETVGEPRLFLFYDEFFDGADPARRLAQFLDVPAGLSAHIREDLRHHTHGSEEVIRHPEVPEAVKDLWRALERFRQGGQGPADEAELNRAAYAYRDGFRIPWSRRLRWYGRWVGGTLKMMMRERGFSGA